MAAILKPPALIPGSRIRIVSPASPSDVERVQRGCAELRRLGYDASAPTYEATATGYFAAPSDARLDELWDAWADEGCRGVFCARGGYGSNYLLPAIAKHFPRQPRILLGYSDITSLQVFLWQQRRWVTFYGPMVAAGLDAGADVPGGYDSRSLACALTETASGWAIELRGESLVPGQAEGNLLGGCLTLLEAALGTQWELEMRDSILLLEDRAMKPYQVDRVLMHLLQAGKLKGVRGIILGEFPGSEPPVAGSPTVKEVCRRILGELRVPVVWGAPAGHTPRAMLTLPLGVRVRLNAEAAGNLEILEPAVTA